MLSLLAKIRKDLGKKVKTLRKRDILPAVLYGPKIKEALPIEVDLKEFEKVYQESGESSLILLKIEKNAFKVLIHQFQEDPLSGKFLHVDFYQPILTEEIEAKIPLFFEGVAPAVKDLGGTLIKNISEIEVKALPENLPHRIKVDLSKLKTFEDYILVKDLLVGEKVKILKAAEEIIAQVLPLEKTEEELKEPVEEKVGKVEEKQAKIEEIKK